MSFETSFFLLLLVTFVSDPLVISQSVCGTGYNCIPYAQCRLDDEFLVVYPCTDGGASKVCCPNDTKTTVTSRLAAFPEQCGPLLTDDRITGGERARLGEFPWMVLLGYKQASLPIVQYLCGATVITDRHVLTAAHCIFIESYDLVHVRFGELDLTTAKDCEKVDEKSVQCGDDVVDVAIERTMPHGDFEAGTLRNDIALVKTRDKIKFTRYIRPICLPFGTYFQPRTYHDELFVVSGWGKTDTSNVMGSNDLRSATVTVWPNARCNASIPPTVRPLKETQICANGAKSEDACKGDSGGPLTKVIKVHANEPRFYQIGIVSFASARVCGHAELPTIYTRVDRYLDWIVDNVIH